MANYDDYEIDEMENSAVEKSKNLKRGIVAGAAALGAGGTAAFAASAHTDNIDDTETEITSEDLLAGLNAAVEEPTVEEPTAAAPQPQVVHNEVHIHQPEPQPTQPTQGPEQQPQLDVEQSTVFYDSEGNLVGIIDEGEVGGMKFMAIDSDQNGKADIVAIDENLNGQFDDDEFYQADNKTMDVLQGRQLVGVVRTDDGELIKIMDEPNPYAPQYAYNPQHGADDIDGIRNDFLDERTGEVYRGDLAENNMDYNNRGGEQYSAGLGDSETITIEETSDLPEYTAEEIGNESATDYIAANEEYSEPIDYSQTEQTDYGYTEQTDYGYSDPTDDGSSFDSTPETFDDTVYNA